MSSEYIFLSRLVPKEMESEVFEKSNKSMLDAANALEWHIYNGLCENLQTDIRVFNLLAVASFPQYYKDAFVKRSLFDTDFNKNNINIGFCNVKLLRQWSAERMAYVELKKWFKENPKTKIVFVYTASVTFLKALRKLKKRYPFKICCIIADLPDMGNLSSKKSLYVKIAQSFHTKNAYSLQGIVDYYVLLTKHMADYMSIDKPFCVMEGISTVKDEFECPEYDSKEKTVFYAGTLHKKFGVPNLLKAFQQIEDEDYRLVICGTGDAEDEITTAAKSDSRIQFYGQLKRQDVLKLQSKATVLVNPRQNNEVFTKYSFPSKNLEYLSSGIPCIAYKLDGIPDEYDDYFYYVQDDEISSLKNKIIEVCELSAAQREAFGKKSQSFVMEEKNQIVQTRKIVDLILK